MPIYRVLRRLSKGQRIIEPGTLTELEWLTEEQQAILVDRGAVSRMASPPLSVLPGWRERGKKLAKLEVETAEEFLTADSGMIAAELRVKGETVERWKREVLEWLVLPQVPRR